MASETRSLEPGDDEARGFEPAATELAETQTALPEQELRDEQGRLLEEFKGKVRVRIELRDDPVPYPTKIHPQTYWLAHDIATLQAAAYDRYFRSRIRTRTHYTDADDARQEALLGLMERCQHAPPDLKSGAMGLAYGIGAHKVGDHRRRGNRDRSDPAGELPEHQTGSRSIEDIVAGRLAAAKALRRAIQSLPPKQRQALELIFPNPDIRGEELAKAAELRGGAPAGRLIRSRAFATLRDKIQTSTEEDVTIYAAPEEPSTPKQPDPAEERSVIPVGILRTKVAIMLREAFMSGEREVSTVVPEYLGPLLLAAQDMNWHLRQPDTIERALVVYSHGDLDHLLVEHMCSRIRRSDQDRIHLLSPRQASALPAQSSFEYVVGIGELDDAVIARLRCVSFFLLRLHTNLRAVPGAKAAPEQADDETARRSRLITPLHHEISQPSGRSLAQLGWRSVDSVNYLKEYWLMHGRQLHFEEAQKLGKRHLGPPIRLLSPNRAQFAALQEKADYGVYKVRDTEEAI